MFNYLIKSIEKKVDENNLKEFSKTYCKTLKLVEKMLVFMVKYFLVDINNNKIVFNNLYDLYQTIYLVAQNKYNPIKKKQIILIKKITNILLVICKAYNYCENIYFNTDRDLNFWKKVIYYLNKCQLKIQENTYYYYEDLYKLFMFKISKDVFFFEYVLKGPKYFIKNPISNDVKEYNNQLIDFNNSIFWEKMEITVHFLIKIFNKHRNGLTVNFLQHYLILPNQDKLLHFKMQYISIIKLIFEIKKYLLTKLFTKNNAFIQFFIKKWTNLEHNLYIIVKRTTLNHFLSSSNFYKNDLWHNMVKIIYELYQIELFFDKECNCEITNKIVDYETIMYNLRNWKFKKKGFFGKDISYGQFIKKGFPSCYYQNYKKSVLNTLTDKENFYDLSKNKEKSLTLNNAIHIRGPMLYMQKKLEHFIKKIKKKYKLNR